MPVDAKKGLVVWRLAEDGGIISGILCPDFVQALDYGRALFTDGEYHDVPLTREPTEPGHFKWQAQTRDEALVSALLQLKREARAADAKYNLACKKFCQVEDYIRKLDLGHLVQQADLEDQKGA